jgi:hypothetical protein
MGTWHLVASVGWKGRFRGVRPKATVQEVAERVREQVIGSATEAIACLRPAPGSCGLRGFRACGAGPPG